MAEAADLLGVSYHTISRAVRRGQLPARRLGRMALISAADLAKWQPKRARAPREDRHREPQPTPLPSPSDPVQASSVPSVEQLQAITRFVAYRQAATSHRAILHQLAIALADIASLEWVGVWLVSDDGGHLARTDEIGRTQANVPDHTLPLTDERIAPLLALPGPTLLGPNLTESPAPTLLAASLRLNDGPRGFLLADRNGAPLTLSPTELALVELLLAAAEGPMRGTTAGRTDGLAQVSLDRLVSLMSEPAAVIDASGEIRAYNGAFRDLFNLSPSAAPGNIIDLIHASERQAHMGPKADGISLGAKMLNDRLRQGGAIDVPITLSVFASASTLAFLVSVRPVSTPNMAGDQAYVVTFKESRGNDWNGAEAQARHHLAQMEVSAARAASMARLSQAVNSGIGLNDVLHVAIERLTMLLDGHCGAIFLRGPGNQYTGQAQIGFDEHDIAQLVLTEDVVPTTAIAIRSRRPMYYTYEDATPSEREFFDRLGFRAATIAPLILDNDVIGVAYVNFTGPHRVPTGEDLRYAAALADQCAVAIGRTRLMERWEAAHRRLLTVIDHLPQGVVIVDAPHGELVLANRAAESLWQVPLTGTAEAPSENVADLLRAEESGPWPALRSGDAATESAPTLSTLLPVYDGEGTPFPPGETPLERTLRTGESRIGEPLIIPRPDGTTVTVVGNHVPIMDNQGRITGAVSVLQDIAQLKELDRAKDEFLSVVAHELRNPLTSLRGNLQLLARRLRRQGDPERQDELERLEGIIAQADRIGELVTRLLDVSRADLGRLDLSLTDADAAAAIRAAVQSAQGLTKKHRFIVHAPDAFPVVWDVVRIEQVLQNLLSNAVKYAVPGNVEVSLTPLEGDRFAIAVRDEGPGIPDSAKARLFERYYRANHHSDHAKDAEGLGIGLYISHKIIQAHGGSLTVTDSPEGGSVFTITLPRVATPNTAKSDPATAIPVSSDD